MSHASNSRRLPRPSTVVACVALLVALAQKPGRILTRGQLLEAASGDDDEPFDRAIDAHIKNIRRKLEPDSRRPRYIRTVYGVGYKFAES